LAKIGEEGPTVLDVITKGEVDLVLNTMSNIYTDPGEEGGPVFKDGFEIRRAAVERRIPCLTSLDTAAALLEAEATASSDMEVLTIGEWRDGSPLPFAERVGVRALFLTEAPITGRRQVRAGHVR